MPLPKTPSRRSPAAASTVQDNELDSPQTVALAGTGADFSVGPAAGPSTSTNVRADSPAVFPLSIDPIHGHGHILLQRRPDEVPFTNETLRQESLLAIL